MLNTFVRLRESAYRLRNNEQGVVSFEYIIVAFCVVGAVVAVFGVGTGGAIQGALSTAMGKVLSVFASGTT